MLVRDAMSRHLITISMEESLRQVQQVFEAAPFHHLVVVDEGRVVGVISDRDLLANLSPFVGKMAERTQDLAVFNRRVHQFMSRHVKTIGPDEPVTRAGQIMLRDRVSCLPVVNDLHRPIGIITIRDVARVAIDMLLPLDEAA